MKKEIIEKLIRSKNKDDVLLGLNFLVGMSRQDVLDFFEISEGITFLVSDTSYVSELEGTTFQISPDCIVYKGYNLLITPYRSFKNHIDLTI